MNIITVYFDYNFLIEINLIYTISKNYFFTFKT